MPRVRPQPLLRGQKALVTGGNSGIGRAIALALCEAGAEVVVNYERNEAQALAIRADVSDEEQVRSLFSIMKQHFGTLDILVNNAGLQQDAPFHEMTLAQWNKVISVNSLFVDGGMTLYPGFGTGG